MATHIQSFWTIFLDSSDRTVRSQVAKAALHLQRNIPDVLLATSAGGYDDNEELEVSLLTPVGHAVAKLRDGVISALDDEGLEDYDITLEDDSRFYTLSQDDEGQVALLTALDHTDDGKAKDSIYELVGLMGDDVVRHSIHEAGPYKEVPVAVAVENTAGETLRSDLLAADLSSRLRQYVQELSQKDGDIRPLPSGPLRAGSGAVIQDVNSPISLDGFSVSAGRYQRMKNAKEGCVATEMQALRQGLQDLANSTKSNEAIVIMLIRGIMTVGNSMHSVYRSLEGASHVPTMISGLIAASGGLTALVRTVAPIVATLTTTSILQKDAVNELIIINALTEKLYMTDDCVKNGQSYAVTREINSAPRDGAGKVKPMAYPAGIYLYGKNRFNSKQVTHRGSNMAIAFKVDRHERKFVFGMNCPNANFEGKNNVTLQTRTDAEQAVESVASRGQSSTTITMGKVMCTASCASPWGSVNRAICCIWGELR